MIIRFNAGRLWMVALTLALPAACFLWMLLSPETFLEMRGRRAWLVHFLAGSPLVSGGFTLFFGYVAVRAVMTALAGGAALAITPSSLEARTIFSRHAPSWRDLKDVHVDANEDAPSGCPTIRVEYRRGDSLKNVRIHGALLDADGEQLIRFLDSVDEHLARRDQRVSPAGAAPEAASLSPYPSRIAGFGRKGI